VVIAGSVEQTEIPFGPQDPEEPSLNVVKFDSGRFKSAFRTALKDGE